MKNSMKKYKNAKPYHSYGSQILTKGADNGDSDEQHNGMFTSLYHQMAIKQSLLCMLCHPPQAGFNGIPVPEDCCVKCLGSKVDVAYKRFAENEFALALRNECLSKINKRNQHLVRAFKTKSCPKMPCLDGSELCLYLHGEDDPLKNMSAVLTRGFVESQNLSALVHEIRDGIFSPYYEKVYLQQVQDCFSCNPRPWVKSSILLPDQLCVSCLIKLARLGEMLDVENPKLMKEYYDLEKMEKCFDHMVSRKLKTKLCKIKSCTGENCYYAHDESEIISPDQHPHEDLIRSLLDD